MSEPVLPLAEYEELIGEQRRLIETEDYDALNASFTRAAELEAQISAALRGTELTPALRDTIALLRDKSAENAKLLSERMNALGKSNARRADIRRGIAGYDPLPFRESGIIDVNM
ncbi:MAG: hypothetical protein LBK23_01450 [Oscillospiraceae bacterium]|jgi:hypothetical protein|nr:hypothetical protein [Oscillospiraceae bacterium]